MTRPAHPDVIEAMRAARPSAERLGPTLAIHAAMASLSAIYEEVLEILVFGSVEDPARDTKEVLSYRRTLKDSEAQAILTIIWRESDFVDKQSLEEVGLKKTFDDRDVTVYGLAVMLASSPLNLAKINSRIRSICMAAEYFGLIERERTASTRSPIRGTEKLHILMLAIAGHAETLLSERLSSQKHDRKSNEKA